jgi:hypothetical protein
VSLFFGHLVLLSFHISFKKPGLKTTKPVFFSSFYNLALLLCGYLVDVIIDIMARQQAIK